jgi:hypothetical protein
VATDGSGDTGSQNYILVVNPAFTATLTLSPATVTGGTASSAAVTLNEPAFAGAFVLLESSNTAVVALAGTTASAGQTTITIPLPTKAVTQTQLVTITASLGGGVLAAATLTVNPPVGPPPPVSIVVPETITVGDTEPTSPGIADNTEIITVSDVVGVAPLLNFASPAASFSTAVLGFNATSGSAQLLTLANVGDAPLAFSSPIRVSAGFKITQIICSNSPTSLPTSLPSGGTCVFAVSYTGTSPSGSIVFTDNAALSNAASVPTGSNYTQTIGLSASGNGSGPLAPPSLTVLFQTVPETITVTDVTTIPASNPCVAVISAGVTVTRGGFVYNPITRQYTRTYTLANSSGAAISGPIYLLVAGLSSNATLLNPSGKTTCNSPGGIPYVTDSIISLAPGGNTTIVLKFSDSSTAAAITYTAAVEAGSGAP